MNIRAILAAAVLFTAAAVVVAQTTTTTGNMSNMYALRVRGTMTVVRGGKTTVYKDGQDVTLWAGDKVTLNGSLESISGNGKALALSSGGGSSSFDVLANGSYAVTEGSLQVTKDGQTGTASKGQTIQVVQTTTATQRGRATMLSHAFSVVVSQTSTKQETTNSGTTNTVSPSAP